MNTAKFSVTILMVGLFLLCTAHEEPAKTLNEKKQKQHSKALYVKRGIKSVTLWKISSEFPDGKKLITMGYDNDGTYRYVEAFKNDSLTLSVQYSYSKSGNMISDSDCNPDQSLVEKNIYKYDKKGRVVSGESFEKNDVQTSYFQFIHSKSKKSIEFYKYMPDKKLEYSLKYTYETDFDTQDYSQVEKISPEGRVVMKVEKQYYENGLVKRKLIFGEDGDLINYFEYYYDDNKNNIKITKNESDGKLIKTDSFAYDKYGICTEQNSYDANNEHLFQIVYEFQYY